MDQAYNDDRYKSCQVDHTLYSHVARLAPPDDAPAHAPLLKAESILNRTALSGYGCALISVTHNQHCSALLATRSARRFRANGRHGSVLA